MDQGKDLVTTIIEIDAEEISDEQLHQEKSLINLSSIKMRVIRPMSNMSWEELEQIEQSYNETEEENE